MVIAREAISRPRLPSAATSSTPGDCFVTLPLAMKNKIENEKDYSFDMVERSDCQKAMAKKPNVLLIRMVIHMSARCRIRPVTEIYATGDKAIKR